MSPFTLAGTEFLWFYAGFAVLVILAVSYARQVVEPADAGSPGIEDPYDAAYLRGGFPEALRVVAITLIDRGLLVANANSLRRSDEPAYGLRPLESKVHAFFQPERAAGDLLSSINESWCAEIEVRLREQGFLPDLAWRFFLRAVALVALAGVAGTRLLFALAEGRTNVEFLILLSLGAIAVAMILPFPRLTLRGKEELWRLKETHPAPDRQILLPRGDDRTWAAAIYGAALFSGVLAWESGGDSGGSGGCGDGGGGCGGCGCGGCGG